MSQSIRNDSTNEVLGLESALEAFETSPEFRGPVESLDGHHCNDHFALIYETETEQLAAAIPFIRQGLERGERCVYIVDETAEEDVSEAMGQWGIDVDAAKESGQLTFHTVQETYLRSGTFDPDEMIDFYAATIEETTAEYEALRVTAETTWLQDTGTTVEDFMEYEAKVNDLFADKECIALCQYDRTAFPSETVRDIVKTHPHLIYEGTVCHNVYHTPPEEFLGPDEPAREVDRMMNTLLERTRAKTALRENNRHLREQHEIVSSPHASFEEKLQGLFEIGRERFGLELGATARVDPGTDRVEIEHVSDIRERSDPGIDHPKADFQRLESDLQRFDSGIELPLSELRIGAFRERDHTVGVTEPTAGDFEETTFHEEFGVCAYLGTRIELTGNRDRMLFFVSSEARTEDFSRDERTFLRLMGQWLQYELERRQRERRLTELNTLTRTLLDAETATDVSEQVVEAARGGLNMPVAAMALYDEDAGVLRPDATTDDVETFLQTTAFLEPGEGAGWAAFVEGVQYQMTGADADPGLSSADSITELAAYPLADHGVFIVGTTATGGFCPNDLEFAETVATDAREALDRVEHERQLHEREQTLEEQNATLERLNRINDTIRSIDRSLVQASTRREIEAVVCEQLAAAGPYELAWIGEHDAISETITPVEWAGDERGYLDDITIRTDDSPEARGPTGKAVETRQPQVVNNVLKDHTFEPWRQDALNRGYHATIALPLLYEGTLYGVLNVYASQPGVFDDLERAVLSELADNIAYAVNAVESKKALVSDEVTELEFAVNDGLELLDLTRTAGCDLAMENVVPGRDGSLRLFFTSRGVSPDEVHAFLPQLQMHSLELLSEREEGDDRVCLFEARLSRGSLVQTVLEHGGIPKTLEVEDDTATVVVELAAGADISEFVQMFQSQYQRAELIAQRSYERSQRTVAEMYAEVTDELTARQLEVLQTAYASGYFEQPRIRNGSEIADVLDISQPTLTAHLRTAQRKVCRILFEENSLRSHVE